MRTNISFDVGSLILINKVNTQYKFFDFIFSPLQGKTKHLKQSVKAFIYNRLGKCVSVCRINEVYPTECFEALGFKENPKERTLYRDLERIGIKCRFVIERYQQLLKRYSLISTEQFLDFSSAYFEGNSLEFGAFGYSRDHRPDKKQIVFGVSTGINGVPTGLTIQRGNMQDKKHFNSSLKIAEKVLEKGSALIFDCGGNSKENKKKVVNKEFNYLTLRPKKQKTYKKYIEIFKHSPKEIICVGGRKYKCLKIKEKEEIKYMYYSKKLYREQIRKRNRKFQRELKKNEKVLKKLKIKRDYFVIRIIKHFFF